MMELCLAQLTPAYWCGFDAVSSRLPPPFSSFQSSVALLLMIIMGFRSYTRFLFFAFFCFVVCIAIISQTHRHCAQHIITPSVITLRPFTPCFNSWCILCGLLFTPPPWWFFRYSPLMVFVEGGVLETPAHPKLFRESPLCTTMSQTFPLFPTLPACSIVSGFFLPSFLRLAVHPQGRNQSIFPLSTIL